MESLFVRYNVNVSHVFSSNARMIYVKTCITMWITQHSGLRDMHNFHIILHGRTAPRQSLRLALPNTAWLWNCSTWHCCNRRGGGRAVRTPWRLRVIVVIRAVASWLGCSASMWAPTAWLRAHRNYVVCCTRHCRIYLDTHAGFVHQVSLEFKTPDLDAVTKTSHVAHVVDRQSYFEDARGKRTDSGRKP